MPRSMIFFTASRTAYSDNPLMFALCFCLFYSRPVYHMTFDFHQFDFGTLFSQEGRINEGGRRILKLLLAKISDKLSTLLLFVYSIYVKTFYSILSLYLLSPRTFFLFRCIEYLITVYIVIAIYRAELFPSLIR